MIFGNRSMDTVRRPLCGCFVLSCMVGGIVENPRAFGRCLPPARPEKAKPFQAGRSPCTKRPQTVRLGLYAPKKVFGGSKGRFFKNAPLAGEWDRVPQRENSSLFGRVRLFRRDEVLSRNAHRPSGFTFTHRKKFLRVPRGVFSKTLLGRVWDRVPQRESEPAQRGAPFQAGRSPFTKHRQIVRLRLDAPKKVFEGSKGRFFKNAPLAGCGTGSHKRRG